MCYSAYCSTAHKFHLNGAVHLAYCPAFASYGLYVYCTVYRFKVGPEFQWQGLSAIYNVWQWFVTPHYMNQFFKLSVTAYVKCRCTQCNVVCVQILRQSFNITKNQLLRKRINFRCCLKSFKVGIILMIDLIQV